MTREEKGQIIEELSTKFEENSNFYITDASGLTVEQINAFRKLCFDAGVEYGVYKNTLIQKALEKLDADYVEFTETVLKGFSGIIFSKEVANTPAKVITNFRKSDGGNRPMLKGASIDHDLFIGVSEQAPDNEGCCNPALSDTTERHNDPALRPVL